MSYKQRNRPQDRYVVKNLSKKMSGLLSRRILSLLRKIGIIADQERYPAFIVGGLVRDLVMGRPNIDLDVVVEGEGIAFADRLVKKLGGTLVVHQRFGTASVYMKDGLKIDVATARKELYKAPAALPTVESSILKNDLSRRDFTINAMAVSLNRASFGQLIDFFGGERDLEHGRIRVMHDSSFIDDPTRIFRAVRFEQRFGFTIEGHTEDLIKHAIREKMFNRTEKQRIREELILILKEPDPIKGLRRMDELHELGFIHPEIKFSSRMEAFFRAVKDVLGWYGSSGFRKRVPDAWLVYLMALVDGLSYNELQEMCGKFVFVNRDRMRILLFKKLYRRLANIIGRRGKVLPHRVFAILEPLPYEVILAVMAKARSRTVSSRIEEFFGRHHGTRLGIRGNDLKALGLKPGPRFKKILNKILYRKVDGYLKTKADEIEYAKRLIRYTDDR